MIAPEVLRQGATGATCAGSDIEERAIYWLSLLAQIVQADLRELQACSYDGRECALNRRK